MVASDLVITRGTYNVSRELHSLGVPSVSISYRLNPIDDIFAERIPTNSAIYADKLDVDKLAAILTERLEQPTVVNGNSLADASRSDSLQRVAAMLADAIRQLKPSQFKR